MLTDDQFEQYQREGYVVVDNVLSDDAVTRVIDRLREYSHEGREPDGFTMQREPGVERGEVSVDDPGDAVRKFEGLGMVKNDAVFHDVATHEHIVNVIEELLGPDLKLLRSAAMCKPPQIGSEKGLHQDAAYYPIQPMDHVTVWIALDDATPENGCMTVQPGAHVDGIRDHETVEYDTDIVIPDDEAELVELPMKAGDALFSHCLLPHRTAPNTTDDWRRALIMAYMTARSRFTQAEEERPPWVDSVAIQGESYPGCV